MSLHTRTLIFIAGEKFEHFHSLELQQSIYGHHSFRLTMGYNWLQQADSGLLNSSQAFLGQEITIKIMPLEKTTHYGNLLFHGIVTAVHTGKGKNGDHGFCILQGGSPTLLLDNTPHTRSYEQQQLPDIVRQSLQSCLPYTRRPLVVPVHSSTLKYTVQYRESNFAFLQRLSQRFGEWFFYNGEQVIFGRHLPRKHVLEYPVNLLSYDLSVQVQPGNTQLHAYEYRRDMVVEENAQAQGTGVVNRHTRQALHASNRLYASPSLYKQHAVFSSNIRMELAGIAALEGKNRAAQLVHLKGHSIHAGLRPGDTADILEGSPPVATPGTFMITRLTHYCTSNGGYYNIFNGIPADTAMPPVKTCSMLYCEPQSAVVTDNNDPKGLGRVRVRFRWQQQGHSPWIRMITPHGGAGKGIYFMPEKGEEVWVDFEGGNPEAPFVLGAVYNGNASAKFGDAQNNIKVIRTRSGHTLLLDDSNGAENITITDKNDNVITLDTSQRNIHIKAPENISIAAKNIRIQAAEHIEMQSGKNIVSNAGASMHVSAVNSHTLRSGNIRSAASGAIVISAAQALRQSSGEMKLYTTQGDIRIIGSGTTVLQGSKQVKISKG